MNICCYGRKSIYSDHSDSIDNQFRMCRDYVEMKFSGQVDSFLEYQDEAFTGANTKRPDLQRLLADISAGNCDVLIVYQLDRLSRDVRDFANIYAILEEHHVKFISIKENIDTSTPIGRAMMYVTVVFAQMERETIAARVADNMIGLAKKGYWTGGNPPEGYVRTRIEANGKKHCSIVPDPEGAKYVTWIFDTFLQNGYSLQGMETAFKNQGIRTRRGAFFSTAQLHKILTMPYCVQATPEVYDYYVARGCQMDPESPRESWDGTCGVMIYGRTTQKNKKHQMQPPEKWLVCLGAHEPFMPADKWLTVQARFCRNKFDKTMKYDVPLLKGVLRCSCGSIMCVSRKKKVDGSVSSWYYCLKRMRQGKEVCDSHQIKCELLDQKVLELLQSIERDPALIHQFAEQNAEVLAGPDPKVLASKISTCQTRIDRLVSSLSLAAESSAQKYILAELERLDLEIQALRREHNLALTAERNRTRQQQDTFSKVSEISRLIGDMDSFSASEKNAIVKDVIKKCVWDGESLSIML